MLVSGTIGFYDRYVLQVAPFLGVIVFFLIPHLSPSRLIAMLCSGLVGQIMLWRYVFSWAV